MLSLFLRNLFFTIIQPGVVAGLIPYWIVHDRGYNPFEGPFQWWNYSGAIIFLLGFYLTIDCIYRFAVYGNGTLSPADPTKKTGDQWLVSLYTQPHVCRRDVNPVW